MCITVLVRHMSLFLFIFGFFCVHIIDFFFLQYVGCLFKKENLHVCLILFLLCLGVFWSGRVGQGQTFAIKKWIRSELGGRVLLKRALSKRKTEAFFDGLDI